MTNIGTLAEKRAYKDREAMIDAEEEARQDALEAKWTAYEERAKQDLAMEFLRNGYADDRRINNYAVMDTVFDDLPGHLSACEEYNNYWVASGRLDRAELGRIMAKVTEHVAFKLAESETFSDRLAEIVNELDEDARYD